MILVLIAFIGLETISPSGTLDFLSNRLIIYRATSVLSATKEEASHADVCFLFKPLVHF